MKRILQFLLIFVFSINVFSQLDREHWFAPMVDRTGNGSEYQTLYMSTNETTPFKVDIYNNNAVIGTVVVSKNHPEKFSIQDRDIIIAESYDFYNIFKPTPKGLYLKGEKPFYATLRFSVYNHGEILTSKGTAGIGKEFRAVMAPITAKNRILNFLTSVMATEDDTNVTVSGFKPNVKFSDGAARTQINFKLDKGQSYIIDGIGNEELNWEGFIGAKIVADKPVSITNGNFNGQYATTSTQSSDILMDQGVPVDKLGQEFILMKGNGNVSNGMERAIIVAVEDNTQIYLNGSSTPVKTINEGQFYITEYAPQNVNPYIAQSATHYNMHIKTNKNVYVYQLLAGDSNSSELATGGFNYIPPLSCYLPKKIDEIGLIQENYIESNGNPLGRLNIPTKLNIITESGATIDVKSDGVSLPITAANGPFKVTGTNSWVTYSFPDIAGNVAVFSSSAVTAGISAGDDAVGYGGYFAGFSYIPLITKIEGECLPGVKLNITEGFDKYSWLIKNASGAYVPAPGKNNTNVYLPTQAGIYAVKVKQGSCAEVQTQDFKFYNCTTYTNIDFETCSNKKITPSFNLSPQTYNPSTLRIDTKPTKGTADPQPDGTIIYNANPGESGIDTFKYYFCGKSSLPDCELTQATIKINQVVSYDAVLNECTPNGVAEYDLRKADVTADTKVSKTFYKSLPGAQGQISSDVIIDFDKYFSTDTDVFVRIKNAKGCEAIQKIHLESKYFPVINSQVTVEECDDDSDGEKTIQNLDNYKSLFTNDPSISAKIFVKLSDAQNPLSVNNINELSVNKQQSVYVRFSNTNGCFSVSEIVIKIKTPKKSDIKDKAICPEDTTDLDAGDGYDIYEWYNESDSTKIIGNLRFIDNLPIGKYFVILKGKYPNDCVYRQNVEIKAVDLPVIERIEISGSNVKIFAKGGTKPYKYAIDNGLYQDSNTFSEVSPGEHKAFVISADNCEPAEKDFSVIKIYNFITPNADGVNDTLDLSLLKLKKNVKLKIFDREGKMVFEGDNNNNYVWDGKLNGKPLTTSTYWYTIEWQDFEDSPLIKSTGWILLKNRTSD